MSNVATAAAVDSAAIPQRKRYTGVNLTQDEKENGPCNEENFAN